MVLVIDISIVWASFMIAYILRYNFLVNSFDVHLAIIQGFIALSVYLLFMIVFRLYSGMIRHTTINDTYKIIFTSATALICLSALTIFARKYELNSVFNIPLSILIIHFGFVMVLLFSFRVMVKMFYEFATSSTLPKRNAIIYGSGDMGIAVKRLIESDPKSKFRLKGFIDDDRKKQGKNIEGYPVWPRQVLTKEFFEIEHIDTFIIAINKIAPSKKKEVIESVFGFGCEILDTPSFDTWLNGQLEVKNLKKVNLEDLIGREPIALNLSRIEEGLRNKNVLVTGAAGSIGSEISRQLISFRPNMLLLVDQAETPSFFLQEELKNLNPECNYKVIIGDVTRKEVMEHIFDKYRPQIVFHAAAYKHVPIMELHPREAIRVNVGGTKNMADLSVKYKIEKFVMVSTDKAVNPTNVMGATKKMCELLVNAYSKKPEIKTKFVTTRFGNVLGSNGSVIPIFNKQIAEGGPVTITHPEVTRYFMTIPEACQLVLEAGFMGDDGQIYVFDMGEPIKILDIAKNLIHLSGLEPDVDIKIKFIGLRPGEKLYEERFSDGETLLPTHNPKIQIARIEENNYDELIPKIERMLSSLYKLNEKELMERMEEIVSGYKRKHEMIKLGHTV